MGDHTEALCGNEGSTCIIGTPRDCIGEECGDFVPALVFPFLALGIGLIVHPISMKFRVPYTSMLMVIGTILGVLGCSVEMALLTESLKIWAHISPPTLFFYIFLAPLVFETAFNTDAYLFSKLFFHIVYLAFIVVVAQVFLVAVWQLYVIQSPEWTLFTALVFGSMLSATDPISVTATLKQLGVNENLNTLIEGESLLNDGSAVVFYEAFLDAALEGSSSAGSVIVRLLRLSLGGVAMGMAFALVAICFLAVVYEMFEVEVSMTIVVAFLGFWTAQSPALLSGVICNVTAGVMLSAFGKRLVSPLVRDPLQKIWELLSWLANTIVFVYAGLLVVAYIWSCAGDPLQWFDYVHILTWYAYLNLLRFVLVFLSHPIIRLGNKWYGFKQAAVVSYSGLRGAVTLILALEVGGTAELPSSVRSRVVVWSASIVALTLFVNGSTISTLLHLLRLDLPDPVKEDFLWRARAAMLESTYEILDREAIEEYTKYCSWSTVARMVVPEGWVQDVGKLRRALLATHSKGRSSRMSFYRPSASAMSRRSIEDVHGAPLVGVPEAVIGYVAQEITPNRGIPRGEAARAPGDKADDIETSQIAAEEKENKLAGELEEEFAKIRVNQQLGGALDVEIRRRFLMSLLEASRERNATSTFDFLLLTVLTEDIKYALDANDMGEVYNLFEFVADNPRKLPVPHWMDSVVAFFQRFLDRMLLRLFSKSRYDRRIVLATMVVEAVKHALDEQFLENSELVHKEASTLYALTSGYLTNLESAEPEAFTRIQTKTIIQKIFTLQLESLRQLRTDGKIDMEEYEVIKEELIQLQRQWYMRISKSIPSVKWAKEQDVELLRMLPSFYHLESEVFETSVLEKGRFVGLKNGAIVPSEDAVLFVLRGGVEIRRSRSSIIGEMGATVGLDTLVDLREGVSSVPVHVCISRYGVILPLDFFAHSQCETSQHYCCQIIGEATVFILPRDVMRELAEQYLPLKEELARHMVRLVSYAIASATGPWNDSVGDGENETPLEAGKALLQSLPYSTFVTLEGDQASTLLRGPAFLIRGRVSVLRKSVPGYLLDKQKHQHVEEYDAPAILPNGWVTVEKLASQSAEGPDRVEIVVEASISRDEIAANRIKRWNESPFLVDANGRFGFHRHVETLEVMGQSEGGPSLDHGSDAGDLPSASVEERPSDQ
ncbi:hypothetical protein NDN08_005296 [Rhodosorus marinus]|uniref:Cation/H+ exchanger transmembrane domain-containing protein n=1 Tax=Rhodosorus marinus TaxID=101924 RepID=A0AAV8V559_9RHOD|nr:hypothetical protein NDN08_005296 [Rhodosorus marinus]